MRRSDISAALGRWRGTDGLRVRLVNVSENRTFRLARQDRTAAYLRVHRPDYQTDAAIRSELAWLASLSSDASLDVPVPIAGADGDLLQVIPIAGRAYRAVMFDGLKGRSPALRGSWRVVFGRIGATAARLHRHAAAWVPPPGFSRPRWDARSILGPEARWGDWRKAPGVGDHLLPELERAASDLAMALDRLGQHKDCFGLIHADMRFANLLLSKDRLAVLDFDDCGFGWFGYDFAASVSFFETDPRVPDFKQAWLAGYCSVAKPPLGMIESLDWMILLRRFALLAWISSHAETPLAEAHAATFARGTIDLMRAKRVG